MDLLASGEFRIQPLGSGQCAVFSAAGDFAFLSPQEIELLQQAPAALPTAKLAELYAKHIVTFPGQPGMSRLRASRQAARQETVRSGVSLHILVPTLQCGHSCRYCQVSRSLDAKGVSMGPEQIDAACDTCFESPSQTLTVEFQGGDPLIRFDLIERAVKRLMRNNLTEQRRLRLVVASSLHQLTVEMCAFLREHGVVLSTSIDGPAALHNMNRPVPGRNAYERTVQGIKLARRHIGPNCVSALMTTTRASLDWPEAIVDEYVRLSLDEIFVRPMSPYGFAKRNAQRLAYGNDEFQAFYERCFERVLWWNAQGQPLREGAAAIVLNKLLSPFDAGYVDLQTPTGAGSAVLVYNYDGYVYPSDEARMLVETGDTSFRLGPIGAPLTTLLASPVVEDLRRRSTSQRVDACRPCPFNTFCGPDPVAERAQGGGIPVPVEQTNHCRRSKWLFQSMLDRLERAQTQGNDVFLDLAYAWAQRSHAVTEVTGATG